MASHRMKWTRRTGQARSNYVGKDVEKLSCHGRTPELPRLLHTTPTVRSSAEERTFWGARLDGLIFRLRSYHVLLLYIAYCNGPNISKTPTFLGQAGMFLSFQARRSSATRSSTSGLTALVFLKRFPAWEQRCCWGYDRVGKITSVPDWLGKVP